MEAFIVDHDNPHNVNLLTSLVATAGKLVETAEASRQRAPVLWYPVGLVAEHLTESAATPLFRFL